jgi:hypothetical protein
MVPTGRRVMSAIKRFSWLRTPSAWEVTKAWRAQRSNMVQKYLDDGAALSNAFLNAQNNLSMGLATLSAQASVARVQRQINSRVSTAVGSVDKLA